MGDIVLFMVAAGLACCCGGANVGLPIPGLVAVKAGKDELRLLKVLSGVTVRLCAFGAERFVLGGGETGGVDQENVAAGDALFVDLERFADGRDGRIVDDDADAEAFPHVSPPSMSFPVDEPA